ncbi:MAG TPA: AMP-binding protein, partial [Candidatus Lokiarchaeia archaeon]|nr:AMP-binding protein [Candidatus Lokiarchaeia archaeon]
MVEERFWTKSYDEGMTDLDPTVWEMSYTQSLRPNFEKFSGKMALEFLGVEVTFAQLDQYSNKCAHMFMDNGFQKGDVVGINLANSPQYVIALLGALKAGCVVTGVSPLLSAEEMHYQLNDCGAKGLVTLDAIFETRLAKIATDLPELKVVVATNIADFLPKLKQVLGKALKKVPKGKVTPLAGKTVIQMMDVIKGTRYAATLPEITAVPDDLAYILYTGGTTGAPKGAMLTHRNVVSDLLIVQKWLGWEPGKGIACSGFPFF